MELKGTEEMYLMQRVCDKFNRMEELLELRGEQVDWESGEAWKKLANLLHLEIYDYNKCTNEAEHAAISLCVKEASRDSIGRYIMAELTENCLESWNMKFKGKLEFGFDDIFYLDNNAYIHMKMYPARQ